MGVTKPASSSVTVDISDQDAEWSFKLNDHAQFVQALESGANVNKRIRRQRYSLFEQACKTPGRSAYIAACIGRGANVAEKNPYDGMYPIHLAALSLDRDNLSELLKAPNIQVDEKHWQRTSLYKLFEKIDPENCVRVFDCIKLLLEHDAKLMDENGSPLLGQLGTLGADKLKRRVLHYCLLNHVKVSSLSKEVKEVIENQFPGIEKQYKERENKKKTITFEILWFKLAAGTEDEFLEAYEKYTKKNDGQEPQENERRELLLEAVQRDKLKAAEKLLEKELDANGRFIGKIALLSGFLAKCCVLGNTEMLKWLLKIMPDNEVNNDPLLVLLVKQIAAYTANADSPFYLCMIALVSDPRVDVNKVNGANHTALHYALKCKLHYAQEILLAKGAYIGGKGLFENCLISVLEKHLDSCITDIDRNPGDDEYEVQINFFNFIPPNSRSTQVEDELYLIQQIVETPSTRKLLWHPVIAIVLLLKWQKLIHFLFLNFAVCLNFAVFFTSYIVFFYGQGESVYKPYFQVISWIGLAYLMARELVAIFITLRTYFHSKENLMELVLIVLSTMVLVHESTDESWTFVVVGVLLLIGLELTLQIGMLPVNSIYTNMVMLKRVTKNFLKCLGFYVIIMLSFALSFYTLFRMSAAAKPHEKELEKTAAQNDSSEPQFNDFAEIPLSLVKTAVMFTGEFDASDLKFAVSWPFYLLFIFFLFFVTIVINNLMNGLAVSDTSAIQAESEVVAITEMASIICRHETILKSLKYFIVDHLKLSCLEILFPDLQLFNRKEPLQDIVLKPGQKHIIDQIRWKSDKQDYDAAESGLITKSSKSTDNYRVNPFFNKSFKGMLDKIVKRSIEVLQSRQKNVRSIEEHFEAMEEKIKKMMEEQIETLMQKLVPETDKSS